MSAELENRGLSEYQSDRAGRDDSEPPAQGSKAISLHRALNLVADAARAADDELREGGPGDRLDDAIGVFNRNVEAVHAAHRTLREVAAP